MSDKLLLTKEGLEKLKLELKELIEVRRPEIAQRIKEAREMGDISENSAYDAARQEQGVIEGRIAELEDILKNAQILEVKDRSKVFVGAKVKVHVDGDTEEFFIVGAPEANPIEKKISHESPLGSALLGKSKGEKISVEAPVGKIIYTILDIE